MMMDDDDDEEDVGIEPKPEDLYSGSHKMKDLGGIGNRAVKTEFKQEHPGHNYYEQSAARFKYEPANGAPIDLERDE